LEWTNLLTKTHAIPMAKTSQTQDFFKKQEMFKSPSTKKRVGPCRCGQQCVCLFSRFAYFDSKTAVSSGR
jgi:hypothetical protein